MAVYHFRGLDESEYRDAAIIVRAEPQFLAYAEARLAAVIARRKRVKGTGPGRLDSAHRWSPVREMSSVLNRSLASDENLTRERSVSVVRLGLWVTD